MASRWPSRRVAAANRATQLFLGRPSIGLNFRYSQPFVTGSAASGGVEGWGAMIAFGSGMSAAATAVAAAKEAATQAMTTLQGQTPKLAIVFASVSYADVEQAARAVRSVIGDAQIVGGTSGACVFGGDKVAGAWRLGGPRRRRRSRGREPHGSARLAHLRRDGARRGARRAGRRPRRAARLQPLRVPRVRSRDLGRRRGARRRRAQGRRRSCAARGRASRATT